VPHCDGCDEFEALQRKAGPDALVVKSDLAVATDAMGALFSGSQIWQASIGTPQEQRVAVSLGQGVSARLVVSIRADK
jgi:hypothetical protein